MNQMQNPGDEISIELALTKMWFICKDRCIKAFQGEKNSINQHAHWKALDIHNHKINVDATWVAENKPQALL